MAADLWEHDFSIETTRWMLEPELCEKFITKARKIKNTKQEIFILF
jgi:hypothetical protein